MLKQKMKKTFFRKERQEKEVLITKNKVASKKKTNLREKGITLIALVVTIIILLILAGVAIGTITGENGLFQRASESREASRGGEVKEYVSLTVGDNEVAKLMNKQITNKAAAVQDLLSKGKLTEEEAEQLETVDAITIGGIEVDFSVLNEAPINIKTLGEVYTDEMIGQKLTYSSNEQSEWIVFGKDESGNILITTKEPINANYEVERTVEEWLDYEDNLNTACSGYGATIQGKEVTSRSITLKDINYVTGFKEPEFDTYTFGTEDDFENKKVDYLYPKKGATATIGDKTYTNWMKATNESEAQTFKNNVYRYTSARCYGEYGSISSDYEFNINIDRANYVWGEEGNEYYYAVASRCVGMYHTYNMASYRVVAVYNLSVNSGMEQFDQFCESSATWPENSWNKLDGNFVFNLRPVAVLPPDIKVVEKGGIYDIVY